MQSLFYRLLVTIAFSVPVYLLFRLPYLKKHGKPVDIQREIIQCLFTTYMIGLAGLVFRPGMLYFGKMPAQTTVWERILTQKDINVIPFYTIRQFFKNGLNTRFVINIVANVLMFSPIGFFFPFLWQRWRSFPRMIVTAFAFPLTIEFIQLFIHRSVDIDDIILNATGILLGYGIYRLATFIAAKRALRTSHG